MEGNTLAKLAGAVVAAAICLGAGRVVDAACNLSGPPGVIDPGEACDDGNANENDSCRNDCTLNVCGDAVLRSVGSCIVTGQCDGGNNAGAACDDPSDCPNAACATVLNASSRTCQTSGDCPFVTAGCDTDTWPNILSQTAGVPLETCEPPYDPAKPIKDDIGCSPTCQDLCGLGAAVLDPGLGEECDSGCIGGNTPGAHCARDGDCPGAGGTCLVLFGTAFDNCLDVRSCLGGANNGRDCKTASDCPAGVCNAKTASTANVRCTSTCSVDFSQCVNCGNGLLEPAETCERPFAIFKRCDGLATGKICSTDTACDNDPPCLSGEADCAGRCRGGASGCDASCVDRCGNNFVNADLGEQCDRACQGGDEHGSPCNAHSDCDSGDCGGGKTNFDPRFDDCTDVAFTTCVGGSNNRGPCGSDTHCPEGGRCRAQTDGDDPECTAQCQVVVACSQCGDAVVEPGEECERPYNERRCDGETTGRVCATDDDCDDDPPCDGNEADCDGRCSPGTTGCNSSCDYVCGNGVADAADAGEQCDAHCAGGFDAECPQGICDDGTCSGGTKDGAPCQLDFCTSDADCRGRCSNDPSKTIACFDDSHCPTDFFGQGRCTNPPPGTCGLGVQIACTDAPDPNGPGKDTGRAQCTMGCELDFSDCGRCGNGIIENSEEECDPPYAATCDGGDRAGEPCAGETDCPGGGTCGANRGCNPRCQTRVCGDGVLDADAGEECDNGPSECYSLGNSNGNECGTKAGATACAADAGQCGPPGQGDCFPDCTVCDATACNSNAIRNACTTDCRLRYCGDGKADTGELCDDGLASGEPTVRDASDELDDCPNGPVALADGSACRISPTCADAMPHLVRSDCDDGADAGSLCTRACGTPLEPCDNGGGAALLCLLAAAGSTADCVGIGGTPGPLIDDCFVARTSTCTRDPTTPCAADSDCDGGASGPCGNSDTEPDACRGDCTAARCGDDVVDTGEECDDGAAVCTAASPNAGAPCDRDDDCDGNPPCGPDESDCREACVDAGGDTGEADGGLACEPAGQAGVRERRCVGGTNAGTPCAAHGDCDSGRCEGVCNGTLPDACHGCGNPRCGDGIIDAGEECDDGAGNGAGQVCSATCRDNVCGDGRTCAQTGCTSGPAGGPEECDDGNADDTDDCKSVCAFNLCGDGVPKATEPLQICDDGNTLDWDGCSAACCPEFSGVTAAVPEKFATSRCNQERLAGLVEQVPERLRCAVLAKRRMRRHSAKARERLDKAEERCDAGAANQCCFYLHAAGLAADRVGRWATRVTAKGCIEPILADQIGDVAAIVAQTSAEAREEVCAPAE